MVMTTKLALNPEFEQAKANLLAAREKYAVLLEEYSQLTGVVAKHLETEYMIKLGKKEYELYSCQVEILRLKREISLFQAARNRGEKITSATVQEIIAKEFAEYQQKLENQLTKLKKAEQHFSAAKFTTEETEHLKKLYRSLVRKLHPDLNPGLSDAANALWQRVLTAYQTNNWDELYLLADMVNETLAGKTDFVEKIDSLQLLRDEEKKITQKTAALEQHIKAVRKQVPFSYESMLDDPAQILRKRRELDEQIQHCQNRISELRKIRKNF